jgi:hypothetical protein
VGDVLARLAAKVLNGTARIATAVGGNALVQTVATIATGLPVGQLGGALSMEVAQYASRDDDIDVKKLRRKWGGDEAHVRAEYDSLTQLGALLTDLNAENQRLNGYAMRLDAVQSEAKAIRVLAERSLRSLLVLSGYGPDSADARLAPLLDPTLSLKRESPAFAALESRVTATFGAQTPSGNPRSADARRTEAFLAKVNAELDASASVRPRIEHLVCQMWQVYSSMTDDLSRTDVLADLSPDMARKWSDMARPLLSRVADAKASFNEAYGASGCS